MTSLSNQQKLFCQKYIELGMNGTQAYLSVYKSIKKESTARTNASRLLTNANIQEYIEVLQSKIEKTAIINVEERMKWLSKVVNGEIKHTSYDGNGNSYENEAYISDKMKAIDILNKMDGVYVTKVQDITPPTIVDDI